jgi:hypothetical protein
MKIQAGASASVITPRTVQFLDGYPHAERFSDGVDTDLFTSALFLTDGSSRWLIIGNDLLFLDKGQVRFLRERIAAGTGVPADNIMVSSTHTHSAPLCRTKYPIFAGDAAPPTDQEFIEWMLGRIVDNAVAATKNPQDAEIGRGFGDSSEVGGNRRDPSGPSHPCVPVLLIRHAGNCKPIALMLVVSVHPTVLHEDSRLFSGDFPGHARLRLQEALGDIPVIFHNGASGDQSPRHIARSNTPDEARRLGFLLAGSVLQGIPAMEYESSINLNGTSRSVDLPIRKFANVADAERREREVFRRFEKMRAGNADRAATRTAECDWFGAERHLQFAKLQASGELEKRSREVALPAEIQILRIGEWIFVAWPGEVFVEFALKLREERPDVFVITCANGTTQGYLVTKQAAEEGGYEASGSTFQSPESPRILLETTLEMLKDPAMCAR